MHDTENMPELNYFGRDYAIVQAEILNDRLVFTNYKCGGKGYS